MRKAIFLLLPFLLLGCGPQLRNLPVGEGRTQISGSVGGPLVNSIGTTVPIPYLMGGVTYGISNRLEAHGDLHLLAALFKFAGVTPGVTWFPIDNWHRWTPALSAKTLVFSDFKESRLYPELSATLTYQGLSKWQPYFGLHNTFQTTKSPYYIPSLYAGTSFQIKRAHLYFELDWLDAYRDNRWTPVDYHGIGQHGALAPQFGITFDLSGGHK